MNKPNNFDEFFKKATGFYPYPFQRRMALDHDIPALVSIPTGIGKTAAAILGWLWRRRFAEAAEVRQNTPRRLVYCLPMRVLVEQTRDCAVAWLHNLGLLGGQAEFEEVNGQGRYRCKSYMPSPEHPDKIPVYLLMGGDIDEDWDMYPEREEILIGTQDMLLSRALNRGYSMSRFRWPIQFGLLNNDCLWVLDEVQLMGSGLSTTTQLQAFRRLFGTVAPVKSQWMSATLRPEWLKTVDFCLDKDAPSVIKLNPDDLSYPDVSKRLEASKPLEKAIFKASKDGQKEAELILERHNKSRPGSLTLVVLNTVKRATSIFRVLSKMNPDSDLVLIHSRFRPLERKKQIDQMLKKPGDTGKIVISTQVVEAGVDLSADTLITDLAPWPSLVQRFGRCNRKGECTDASIIWIEMDLRSKESAAPYLKEELVQAAEKLEGLMDARPSGLPGVENKSIAEHVIRRKDIIDLFDTTPDLAGADVDVSRFIRDTDEQSVHVFWRDIGTESQSPDQPAPHRDELCSVPIGEIREFANKHPLWRRDHLEKLWSKIRPNSIYPGLMLMIRSKDGGYVPATGWTPDSKEAVEPVRAETRKNEANDDDRYVKSSWQTIEEHTDRVVTKLEHLLVFYPSLPGSLAENLKIAARWHDLGKAHMIFQEALSVPDDIKSRPFGLMAKAPELNRYSRPGFRHYSRPGFRHELATAIAMLQNGLPDLAAYLAAAHHGKVRLSIRSLPNETHPDNPDTRFARGVWDRDTMPGVSLGGKTDVPQTILDLSYMELGESETTGASWLARMTVLRDSQGIGPFRLTLMEALLRVADWRAGLSEGGVE